MQNKNIPFVLPHLNKHTHTLSPCACSYLLRIIGENRHSRRPISSSSSSIPAAQHSIPGFTHFADYERETKEREIDIERKRTNEQQNAAHSKLDYFGYTNIAPTQPNNNRPSTSRPSISQHHPTVPFREIRHTLG